MSWAADEFVDLDLGDKRLNRRMIKLTEQFARQPMASIPGACGGWAETQAAYRFFASDGIDWRDILAPHWACTQRGAVPAGHHRIGLQRTVDCGFGAAEL